MVEEKELEKEDTKVGGKVYHVSKRASDGKWQVRFANGKKAIKLFDTKQQAMDYTKTLAENQDAGILVHPSKGKNKGRFSSK